MSFIQFKSFIDYGDLVAIYVGYKNVFVQTVVKDYIFQTKFGALRHNDLVGKEYGTKFNCKKGWLYLLHITPEIWTITLPHRTQILYSTDISLITCLLYLKPGSIVIEAGTGSGSLSHAICRTISPNGHLYTFDFHQNRVDIASKEFLDHGISDLVTITCNDVCNNGFNLENVADAVFLDLPKPWKAIKFASKALKKHGGRVCCFSPCIEQVQRTCTALSEFHFDDIQTMECLLRPYEIRKYTLDTLFQDQISNMEFQPLSEKNKIEEKDDVDDMQQEGEITKEKDERKVKNNDIDDLSSKSEDKLTSLLTTKTVCMPTIQVPGHTGFLTFATKVF